MRFVIYCNVYAHLKIMLHASKGVNRNMKKTILCLLTVLVLLCAAGCSLAESAPEAVKAEELLAFTETIRAQALAAEVLNDPAAEDAQSEDGTYFQYEVARIYAAGTTLAAETPINALVFEDSEGPVFRGTGIDSLQDEVLAAYPLDNAELKGTKEDALLYLRDAADGSFVYGRLLRDGQRISALEYGEAVKDGSGFRFASVTYTVLNGLVTSIRFSGLNPTAELQDEARRNEIHAELTELALRDDYRAVKTSRNGKDLTMLGEEDLTFGGICFPALTPDQLAGKPEKDLIDNEDGTWLLRCDGDGYEAVFSCDKKGENAVILSYAILDEKAEGPRAVRLGDLFSEDFCRFRSEDIGMNEDLTELLYGSEGSVPRGEASYNPDDMSLRYITDTAGGQQVELLLKYENAVLTEIIIHVV